MFMDTIVTAVSGVMPNLLFAFLVFIIGYIFSAIISNIATKYFAVKVGLDKKVAEFVLSENVTGMDTGAWFKTNLFYVLMFYVIVSVFDALGIAVLANLMAVLGSVLVLIIIIVLVFKFDIVNKMGNILKA